MRTISNGCSDANMKEMTKLKFDMYPYETLEDFYDRRLYEWSRDYNGTKAEFEIMFNLVEAIFSLDDSFDPIKERESIFEKGFYGRFYKSTIVFRDKTGTYTCLYRWRSINSLKGEKNFKNHGLLQNCIEIKRRVPYGDRVVECKYVKKKNKYRILPKSRVQENKDTLYYGYSSLPGKAYYADTPQEAAYAVMKEITEYTMNDKDINEYTIGAVIRKNPKSKFN